MMRLVGKLCPEDVVSVGHVHDHVDDVTAPAMRAHADAPDHVD